MGLDCVPLGIAKSGHEAEWQEIMEDVYSGKQIPDETRHRLVEISAAAYEVVGAPIVGTDPEADTWAIERKPEDSEFTDEEFLEQMTGYRVLDLVPETCAGLPKYCNAPLYHEVDETSFRGDFLRDCEDIVGSEMLERAWTDFMRPEDAVAYGQALLDAADKARAADGSGKASSEDETPLEDQLDILNSAGKWYKFWGERGHPIWANY